jgi:uncharacterized protein GlcG (DUF336 family)
MRKAPRIMPTLAALIPAALAIVFLDSATSAQDKPASSGQVAAAASRLFVASSITLEEARIIIDTAVKQVREKGGWSTVVVVNDHGDIVSMDRMDGTTVFYERFAIGKAIGAVALQQPTAGMAEQFKTNPARFHSALSMLQGEVLLIPGGFPLIVDNQIVGGAGSAGFGGAEDMAALQAGIAAWEQFRKTRIKKPSSPK